MRGGRLYLAVNGHGVLFAELPLEPTARFEERYDEAIFQGRTLTEMIEDESGIVLHLYVNRTLDPHDRKPSGATVSLVDVREQVGTGPTLGPLAVPYQSSHPGWEAVAVVRTSADRIDMEWKRTDDARTEFAYTSLRWRSGTETVIDRATFRAAYGFSSPASAGVAAEVTRLFDALLRHLQRDPARAALTAVHMTVRAEGAAAERFRYQPAGYADSPDAELVSIPAQRSGSAVWALAPDGTLLVATAEARGVDEQSLPPLPHGCVYTGFALYGGSPPSLIVASWEEIAFTTVGRAGIYVGSLR